MSSAQDIEGRKEKLTNYYPSYNDDFNIFIVEDDEWYGELLQYHLSLNPDYKVTKFSNGKDFLNQLHSKPDLITLDYSLPDIDGIELLVKVKERLPEVPVIVISGQEQVTTALEFLKKGAYDYIVKNDNAKDILWQSIIKARENVALKREILHLQQELGKLYDYNKAIKGNSAGLKEVFRLMEKASSSQINVVVTGETGTGKELVAKAIHYNSNRKNKPFIALNMSTIPKELAESELFGYEKGAFTGADFRKIGKFEEANGGTIFLDEIAELDFSLQTKILRVLQEREITRIGGNEKVNLDVRVIVATHKDLKAEIQAGRFREDLYYRIMGLNISLPALRERGSDILLLAKHFVDVYCIENKIPPLIIKEDAREKLLNYSWPGNVRELKTAMELSIVLSNGIAISAADLSFSPPLNSQASILPGLTLRNYTCNLIQTYLENYQFDVLKVAEVLDVGKSTIYKMIQTGEVKGKKGNI